MVTVRIPTPLRTLTGGNDAVQIGAGTVRQVIEELEGKHPGMRERLLDDKGVRRFVNIYVGDEDIRFLDGLDTEVEEGDGNQHRAGHRRRRMIPGDRSRAPATPRGGRRGRTGAHRGRRSSRSPARTGRASKPSTFVELGYGRCRCARIESQNHSATRSTFALLCRARSVRAPGGRSIASREILELR